MYLSSVCRVDGVIAASTKAEVKSSELNLSSESVLQKCGDHRLPYTINNFAPSLDNVRCFKSHLGSNESVGHRNYHLRTLRPESRKSCMFSVTASWIILIDGQGMHAGVLRDMEQQRIRRERQLDFDMQKTLEEEYKKLQNVENTTNMDNPAPPK